MEGACRLLRSSWHSVRLSFPLPPVVRSSGVLRYPSIARRVSLCSAGLVVAEQRNVEIDRRLPSKPEADTAESTAPRVAAKKIFADAFRKIASEDEMPANNDLLLSSMAPKSQIERGPVPMSLAAGVGVTAAVFVMVVLGFLAKPRDDMGGSVSDLVKRGQLRSDRKSGSTSLKFEDPFNNPLVKMGKKNPMVKMCGRLFRLAPVTLTDEQVASHQNRRIQAYKWKRPVVFLNEGDPVPEGVDPDEIRWIPSNHPFATTTNYINEDLAEQNIYQTRGVPSRVRAEHEALRKKMMEAAKKEPEFQVPDITKQQWSSTVVDEEENPNTKDAGSQLTEGRTTRSKNASSHLRNIDGSGSRDHAQAYTSESGSE